MRNSTSTIIGRLLLSVAIILAVHAAARVMWYWNVTDNSRGYTRPPVDYTIFVDYTSHPLGWLASHVAGAIALLVVGTVVVGIYMGVHALGKWIFVADQVEAEAESEESEMIECTIEWCGCDQHKADIFKDGKWVVPDCAQASCKCGYHEVDEFVDGVWVELQA